MLRSLQRAHLQNLLEAMRRCVFFLAGADKRIDWPLQETYLHDHAEDEAVFANLSVVNERFAKLQDILASAMKHTLTMTGENTATFLDVLAYYEKHEVISSIDEWLALRNSRNVAAHDYETDYADIADHFNTIHQQIPILLQTTTKLRTFCLEHVL